MNLPLRHIFLSLKNILLSGFTYFVIFVIMLVISAKKFRNYKEEYLAKDTVEVMDLTMQEQLISYALTLKGINYQSGGIDQDGFDCSGFTFFVFKKFGYELPHSSYWQFEAGKEIDTQKIEKADLVFFKGRDITSERIGHVGIAISASKNDNFAFIHASSSNGIIIDSLNDFYYQTRFIGAKRMFSGR